MRVQESPSWDATSCTAPRRGFPRVCCPTAARARCGGATTHTSPCICAFFPRFLVGQGDARISGFNVLSSAESVLFVHTAQSRQVTAGIAMASVRGARDNDAFRNRGQWDRSNRVDCCRCRARRALLEGCDTRARLFTRCEGRLRATGQKTSIGARVTSSFELWVGTQVSQPYGPDLGLQVFAWL